MDTDKVRALVEGYYAAMRNWDLDAWLALFAEDIVTYTPVGGPATEGIEGMRMAFKLFSGTLATIDIHPESMFFGGNGAAVKWSATARGHNGADVAFEGINLFEVDIHGKIWRIHAYWDADALFRQLNA